MCGPTTTPETHAMSTSIDNEDIDSLSNGDWIQDSCIRHIIYEQLNQLPSLIRPGYNIVDPSWIAAYVLYNYYHPVEPPEFLTLGNGDPVCGLVIPMNVSGHHWVCIDVNFEYNTIKVYDSFKLLGCANEIRLAMYHFSREFEDYFFDFDALIGRKDDNEDEVAPGWFPDEPCAQQSDVVSCGIYTIINVVNIMRNMSPLAVGQELSPDMIAEFRYNGTIMMRERKALGDIVFDVPEPAKPVDPAEVPLPTTPSPHEVPLPPSSPIEEVAEVDAPLGAWNGVF